METVTFFFFKMKTISTLEQSFEILAMFTMNMIFLESLWKILMQDVLFSSDFFLLCYNINLKENSLWSRIQDQVSEFEQIPSAIEPTFSLPNYLDSKIMLWIFSGDLRLWGLFVCLVYCDKLIIENFYNGSCLYLEWLTN